MFTDRREAGQRLLHRLGPIDPENTNSLALPRSELPLTDVIAEALGVSLDIVLVLKVGLPGQPEFAVAAVNDGKSPKNTVDEDVLQMTRLNHADIAGLAER